MCWCVSRSMRVPARVCERLFVCVSVICSFHEMPGYPGALSVGNSILTASRCRVHVFFVRWWREESVTSNLVNSNNCVLILDQHAMSMEMTLSNRDLQIMLTPFFNKLESASISSFDLDNILYLPEVLATIIITCLEFPLLVVVRGWFRSAQTNGFLTYRRWATSYNFWESSLPCDYWLRWWQRFSVLEVVYNVVHVSHDHCSPECITKWAGWPSPCCSIERRAFFL
jgi:hypothetical protein